MVPLSLVGALTVVLRKFALPRWRGKDLDEGRESLSSENVVTPMPFLDKADLDDPPHKAEVEAKKAEAPKPAAKKGPAKKK